LDPLYHLAAHAIVFFHGGFGAIFGDSSFFAWAFSVVLLVVVVRILIFPLFVRQVKSQRTMQMMQPHIKEIREKWGHDRQRMNEEIMKLQKEHGNPLLGCLPILLQIPLFISLFHVFSSLKPVTVNGALVWRPRVGLSAHTVQQIAEAKLFGVSLSTSFTSHSNFIHFIGADSTNVKIFAVVLIVLMGATTFTTQRQIMSRTGPVDPQQAMVQKVLLYGSPVTLAVFGFRFPIAVLVYWLTTNLWSMGQQFFVIKRMPPIRPGETPARPVGKDGKRAPVEPPAAPRPAPGVRAGAKSRTRQQRPATGTAAAGGTARSARTPAATEQTTAPASGSAPKGTSSTAPRGTRSPNGVSAKGGQGPAKTGQTKAGPAKAGPPAKAGAGDATAGDATAGDGTAGDGTAAPPAARDAPDRVASNGTSTANGANTAKTGGGANAGRNGSAASARRSAGDGDSGAATPPRPPVPAGARRAPGGSRPAKKRGKGKRPGGRR
jgi:YidC/Oxa1 family membrane protein insertase